jgi:hypothetical protein
MAQDTRIAELRARAWVTAWASVLQKTDRIITGLRVTVNIANTGDHPVPDNVPAWTDGVNIYISNSEVKTIFKGGDIVAATLRLKCLNYHELCHVLFTPRSDSEFKRIVARHAMSKTNWVYAAAALEDQRIETWFASMYGASARYFEAGVMEWIINNGTSEAAILLYGRKYLSPKIRLRIGKAFVSRYGQTLWDEFKTVIDSYLTVSLPGEDKKALALVQRYVELLDELERLGGPKPPLLIADDGGDGSDAGQHGGDHAKAGSISIKGAKEARQKAIEMVEDALDADAELEAELADGDGGQPARGNATDGDEGDDNDDDDPSGDSGRNDDGDDVGSAAGAGTATGDDGDPADNVQQMIDDAEEALDDINADDDVQDDVERMLDAVQAAAKEAEPLPYKDAGHGQKQQPAAGAPLAVRQVHGVLSRIRSAAEPETLFRQSHGRVDVRRFVSRQPGDPDFFRTYDSGREDETGVEAVVLVDRSSSMNSRMVDASQALWVLKRAFDRLDIPTTVLLFDHGNTHVAYRPGDRAPSQVPIFSSSGGTYPMEPLNHALRIFYKSQAANKVLITVTDGEWDGNEWDYVKLLKSMSKIGVSSLILGIAGAVKHHGLHGHDHGHDMKALSDLPKAATKLVAGLMNNAV